MSYITNVLLTCSLGEDKAIEQINSALKKNSFPPLRKIDNSFGGDRAFTVDVYGGAFDDFKEYFFMKAVCRAEWRVPEEAQIFIKKESAERFDVFTVCEDKTSANQIETPSGCYLYV